MLLQDGGENDFSKCREYVEILHRGGQFVGARRLLGRPVAISYWNWVEGLGLN